MLIMLIVSVYSFEFDLGNKFIEITSENFHNLTDDNVLFVLYKPYIIQ